MRFGDTGCNSPDALFSHEFDVDAGIRIRALEIVDELREVLNGVNIMVRWWGNQPHTRGGNTHFSNPRIDLIRWQLAALTGLSALGHLDLNIGAVIKVVAGHTKAPGGHLLDSRAAGIAVGFNLKALGVLTALAGIRHAVQAVHGNSQGLMRLGRNRTVAHGTGTKALDDVRHRLHLIHRNRRAV